MIFEPGKAYAVMRDQNIRWMEDKQPHGSPRRQMRLLEGQIIICVGSKVDDRGMEFSKFLIEEKITGWIPIKEDLVHDIENFFQEMT